jgi:hypothetical protein
MGPTPISFSASANSLSSPMPNSRSSASRHLTMLAQATTVAPPAMMVRQMMTPPSDLSGVMRNPPMS